MTWKRPLVMANEPPLTWLKSQTTLSLIVYQSYLYNTSCISIINTQQIVPDLRDLVQNWRNVIKTCDIYCGSGWESDANSTAFSFSFEEIALDILLILLSASLSSFRISSAFEIAANEAKLTLARLLNLSWLTVADCHLLLPWVW